MRYKDKITGEVIELDEGIVDPDWLESIGYEPIADVDPEEDNV